MKNKFFSRLLFVIFIYLSSYVCFSVNNDTINMLQEEYEVLETSRGEYDTRADSWLNAAREDALAITKPEIFISLGMNCACAINFERRKLSEAFFPFDWNITQPDSIYRILENDFKDFLKIENLVLQKQENLDLKPAHHPWHKAYHVLDKLYNIRIMHDFTKKGPPLHDYEHVKDKYYRRVARFYHALTLKKLVYFFRTIITKQEALKLNNLIKKKFPKLKYTLVVINNTPEFKEPWKIKNIKNFFLKNAANYEETKEWDVVFKALKMSKNVNKPL